MRTPTVAGGLFPAGTASTAKRTTFDESPLWFCPTKAINLRTSNQYATDYSSFWKMKVIQKKSMQTLVFDPGGSTGRLHACPFCANMTRISLKGGSRLVAAGGDLERFLTERDNRNIIFLREIQATHSYCGRSLFLRSQADTGNRQSPTSRGYMSYGVNGRQRTP